jgi:hypothetical protein
VSGRRYRPEFVQALTLLARASAIMVAEGRRAPILVGGAVVEFDTRSAIVSGDLDLVSAEQDALSRALRQVGFLPEDRPGRRLGGWYHEDVPIAVDCVSSRYYDGLADRQRIRAVAFDGGEVLVAATEELIADRLGQWEASDRRDGELMQQVVGLLALAETIDLPYLKRRVFEEAGLALDDAGIARLRTGKAP